MTFLFGVAVGFTAATVLAYFMPDLFKKIALMATGAGAAVVAGWDKITGLF